MFILSRSDPDAFSFWMFTELVSILVLKFTISNFECLVSLKIGFKSFLPGSFHDWVLGHFKIIHHTCSRHCLIEWGCYLLWQKKIFVFKYTYIFIQQFGNQNLLAKIQCPQMVEWCYGLQDMISTWLPIVNTRWIQHSKC